MDTKYLWLKHNDSSPFDFILCTAGNEVPRLYKTPRDTCRIFWPKVSSRSFFWCEYPDILIMKYKATPMWAFSVSQAGEYLWFRDGTPRRDPDDHDFVHGNAARLASTALCATQSGHDGVVVVRHLKSYDHTNDWCRRWRCRGYYLKRPIHVALHVFDLLPRSHRGVKGYMETIQYPNSKFNAQSRYFTIVKSTVLVATGWGIDGYDTTTTLPSHISSVRQGRSQNTIDSRIRLIPGFSKTKLRAGCRLIKKVVQ